MTLNHLLFMQLETAKQPLFFSPALQTNNFVIHLLCSLCFDLCVVFLFPFTQAHSNPSLSLALVNSLGFFVHFCHMLPHTGLLDQFLF